MKKKEYIKPLARLVIVDTAMLLAGSPDATGNYVGNDSGNGTPEAKGLGLSWDEEED